MSYFTLLNGEKLYYEDSGNGEHTLVMMHGWTSNHEIYVEPVKMLKGKARCIIYDHRGHGDSKAANKESVTMETLANDLNELITGLSLSNVTLVGWSMGAGVAMTYVRDYGCEALRQVVFCDMTPKQINDDTWNLGLFQGEYTKADIEKNVDKDFFWHYKEFILGAIPKLKRTPRFLLNRGLKKNMAKCDESVLTQLSHSMNEQDHREVVGKITVPLTYFYPNPGSIFSPKLVDWYREQAKTEFKAVEFSNSTHMLIAEHPKEFAEEIAKLL